MSEVVLKRKTRHIKVPISGIGKNGFSLNGGYRNTGAVGPANLGRRFTRTLYKGAYPVGAGGHRGEFVQNILSNNTCCTNDPNIVKRSTINTNGLILSTVTHPTPVFTDCSGSCVKNWVKDFNALNYSQGMFIRTLKIKNICPHWLDETITCHTDPSSCKTVCSVNFNGHPNTSMYPDCNNCNNKSHFIGTRKVVTNTTTKKMKEGAMSSSDYISGLFQARQCLPPPPCKAPYPMALNHQGCDTNYMTPDDAIEAGALPKDWGTCSSVYACGYSASTGYTTHCAFKFNPYTHCDTTPLETRLACPKLGCPVPSQAAVDLWKALVNVGKWVRVTKEGYADPETPVVPVLTFENIERADLANISHWWRGMGNPGFDNSHFPGQRCPYIGPPCDGSGCSGNDYCPPYGYATYPPWGSDSDDCSSGGPSQSVIEWFDAHQECILLKVTYKQFNVCADLWTPVDSSGSTPRFYKADLGNPASTGDSYVCSDSGPINLTQIMAIPYEYAEPPYSGPSTSPFSVEQLQNGTYGSPSGLVYIDCIDWYPLPNKSAPWRRAFTSRSLNSKKPIGIGGIEDLFFKTRLPYQSDKQPWSDESPENRPGACDDTTYIPLGASNSCPIPPSAPQDIQILTAKVRKLDSSPGTPSDQADFTDLGYYNFSPRWRYWTTEYDLWLPHGFQGDISFNITQSTLPSGYTRDTALVEGAGLITTNPDHYRISSYDGNCNPWSDTEWLDPNLYTIHITTTCYDPSNNPITKKYTIKLYRKSDSGLIDLAASVPRPYSYSSGV